MSPVTITLIKREGKLINSGPVDSLKINDLLKGMKEGDKILATYEKENNNGSYAQLAKLHACIRQLAHDSGVGFNEMKLLIKKKAGLIIRDDIKSFGDCSSQELSIAIQAAIETGDFLNSNVR